MHLQEVSDNGLDALRQAVEVRIEHAEHGLLALVGGRLQLRPEAPHLQADIGSARSAADHCLCSTSPHYHADHLNPYVYTCDACKAAGPDSFGSLKLVVWTAYWK